MKTALQYKADKIEEREVYGAFSDRLCLLPWRYCLGSSFDGTDRQFRQ